MNTQPRRWRRFAAAAAALALAGLALTGTAGAAQAATGTGNIDPAKATSLTIHKFDGTPGSAGTGSEIATSGLGNPLNGVSFSITEVQTAAGGTIDLSTNAGWDAIKGATAAQVDAQNGFKLGTSRTVTTGPDGSVTAADLKDRLYLVKETGHGNNNVITDTDPFLVTLPLPQGSGQWLYDVHVYPKNVVNKTVPTKTVANPSALVIGSNVTWTITAPVPPIANGGTAKDYKSFVISDQLDARLANPTVVLTNTTTGATFANPADYTFDPAGLTISLTPLGLTKIHANDVVTAAVTTKVTSVGADGIIKNVATVTTNGSKVSTDTQNPPSTNWGRVSVLKSDSADASKTLDGAIFEIYESKTGSPIATITTSNGGAALQDLWVGNTSVSQKTYFLKETKAPVGYVLPTGDQVWTQVTVKAGDTTTANPVTAIKNVQQDHPALPLTGASGRIILSIVGAALIALAVGAALVKRRRQHQA